MLTELREKVDPKNVAVVVVDVQNDFSSPRGAFDKLSYDISMCQEIIHRLQNLIDEARLVNIPIIYVMSIYGTEPNWYLSDVWLEHKQRRQSGLYVDVPALKKGTWGCEFVDSIKPLNMDVVVVKHRYNAFLNTELDLVLRSRGIKSVIMTGATTNVCVETTAREAFMRDYYVVFTSDCTASHERELHGATLKNIDKYFGVVVSSSEIVNCWHALRSEIEPTARYTL